MMMRHQLASLAIGITIYSTGIDARVLRVCHENQNYPPYLSATLSTDSDSQHKQGLLADLLNASAQQLDIEIKYISAPWKRCILFMKTGSVDALLSAVHDPSREAWGVYPRQGGQIDHSRRLWTVHYRLYHHQTSPLTWNGERLSHNSLGVDAPPGYKIHKRLKEMGALPELSHLPEHGFRMLQHKRLDGYVLEEETAKQLIQREGMDKIVPAQKVFLEEDIFLPFSHHWFSEHPQLADQLWNTLAAQRSAQKNQLSKTYQISDQ